MQISQQQERCCVLRADALPLLRLYTHRLYWCHSPTHSSSSVGWRVGSPWPPSRERLSSSQRRVHYSSSQEASAYHAAILQPRRTPHSVLDPSFDSRSPGMVQSESTVLSLSRRAAGVDGANPPHRNFGPSQWRTVCYSPSPNRQPQRIPRYCCRCG